MIDEYVTPLHVRSLMLLEQWMDMCSSWRDENQPLTVRDKPPLWLMKKTIDLLDEDHAPGDIRNEK